MNILSSIKGYFFVRRLNELSKIKKKYYVHCTQLELDDFLVQWEEKLYVRSQHFRNFDDAIHYIKWLIAKGMIKEK